MNVFERKHEFKTDIQRSKVHLQNPLRRFGSHNYSYIYREVGNFIGFKFWGYYFVFLFCCLVCFCFVDLFCFGFLLRFKIFVYFPLGFFFNAYLSSHVSKLSSFDPSLLYSSIKDLAKITLLMEGSACLIKKEGVWIRFQNQVRSG